MQFKVTNKKYIKEIIENRKYKNQIKSIILKVENEDLFYSDMFKNVDDFFNTTWCRAIDPLLIINKENRLEIATRADGIINVMVPEGKSLQDLKVLDLGCGDGSICKAFKERNPSLIVGYDIKLPKEEQGIIFTDKWEEVEKHGPYDFILGYNVFDYVMNEPPEVLMEKAAKVLSSDGLMSLRFFPWIGRFGGDIYHQFNRAFAHLIFPKKVFEKNGIELGEKIKVIHPILTYNNWITKAGLKSKFKPSLVPDYKEIQPVEDFFKMPFFKEKFMEIYKNNSPIDDFKNGKANFYKVMGICYVDYMLGK